MRIGTTMAVILFALPIHAAEYKRVLFVTVSGASAEHVESNRIFRELFEDSYRVRLGTMYPSSTLPTHASLVTGVSPQTHRMYWDEYKKGQAVIRLPTIFQTLKANGWRTHGIVTDAKLRHVLPRRVVDTTVDAPDSRTALLLANQALQAENSFVFVNLQAPARKLKVFGRGSEEHFVGLNEVFIELANMLGSLRTARQVNDDLPNDLLLVFVSDFADVSPSSRIDLRKQMSPNQSVFAIRGAGINRFEFRRGLYGRIWDVAPTILGILGLEPPETYEGKRFLVQSPQSRPNQSIIQISDRVRVVFTPE